MKVTILKKMIKEGVSARTGNEYKIKSLFVKFEEENLYKKMIIHLKSKGADSDTIERFLNYAYLIKLIQDNEFLFFATDLEWHDKSFEPIYKDIQKYNVSNFLIECNYNDYLYHKMDDLEMRKNSDRHFSDNELVRFLRQSKAINPKVITIHGSNKLSADSYTKKYIGGKLPTATIAVGIGAKNGVKNIFKL